MGIIRNLAQVLLATNFATLGCENVDSASASSRGPAINDRDLSSFVVHAAKNTDEAGNANFSDESSGENVRIEVLSDSGEPIENARVRFIDGNGFEGFTASREGYSTVFELYPHNSSHTLTMPVSGSAPRFDLIETGSLEERTFSNFDGVYFSPTAVNLGEEDLDFWERTTERMLYFIGPLLELEGSDRIFGVITESAGRLDELTKSVEFPDVVYEASEVKDIDGSGTKMRWLRPVDGEVEDKRRGEPVDLRMAGIGPDAKFVSQQRNASYWSLDGARTGFVLSNRDNSKSRIAVADGNGDNVEVVADLIGRTKSIYWSLDGNRFIIVGDLHTDYLGDSEEHRRRTGSEANLVDLENRKITSLGRIRKDDLAGLSWSPEGNEIAFSRKGTLNVLGLDGRRVFHLDNGQRDYEPSWTFDGNGIVFLRDTDVEKGQLWAVDRDGENEKPLTAGGVVNYTLSPRGDLVVYETWDAQRGEGGVWLINTQGEASRQIARKTGMVSVPRFSPDGKSVAFMAGDNYRTKATRASNELRPLVRNNSHEIYVADIRTNEVRRITDNDFHDELMAWTDRGIIFSSDRTGESLFYIMDGQGSGQRSILDYENVRHSAWSLSTQTAKRD